MSSYIEFKDVYKRYQMGESVVNAADGVSFNIEEGEFAVILGASGAGKTTVLNMLGGIDTCNEGSITVAGRFVDKLSEKELIMYRRNDVGFVFQFYNLIQNLTAKENVELATQICENHMDVDEVLEQVGLKDRKNNFPAQLSGGEQQRVAIARALAKSPKLLLCDEPTGALDYVTGKMVLSLLQETSRKNNMTVVLITHDMHLMLEYTPRAIVFNAGQVIADKSAAEVLNSPEIVEAAHLKETSLYHLCSLCAISNPEEFTRRFIARDREVRV